MKTNNADQWFSKCIREQAQWRCEYCGRWFDPHASRGLDCSHFIGRSNWSVRFDPDNAFAHCYGCHSYFEKNPHKFVEWVQGCLGPERYQALLVRSEDASIAKRARKAQKKIANHYQNEYRRLVAKKEENPLLTVMPFRPEDQRNVFALENWE